MDAFLDICQGLGVGLGVGALLAALAPQGGTGLAVVAAVLGAVAAFFSISADDQQVLGGIAGLGGALFSAAVVSGTVSGALRRAEAGSGGIQVIVVVAAIAVAGLSLLVPPVSLAALAGLGWLALGRRRRAQRKYEGLRILR